MKKLREYIQHLADLKHEENGHQEKTGEVNESKPNGKQTKKRKVKNRKEDQNPWNVKWVIE